MKNDMKLPSNTQAVYGIQSLIQIIFFVIGLFTHDWFWLVCVAVMSPNHYRITNYEGHEEK